MFLLSHIGIGNYVTQKINGLLFYEVLPGIPLFRLMNKAAILAGTLFFFIGVAVRCSTKSLAGVLLCVMGGTNEYLARSLYELKKTKELYEKLSHEVSEAKALMRTTSQATSSLAIAIEEAEPLLRNAEVYAQVQVIGKNYQELQQQERELIKQIASCENEHEKKNLENTLRSVRARKAAVLGGE